jgi:hypothetical protein
MPNRNIRESIRTSRTIDALSDGAEAMFYRLTTVADDYGRFQAESEVLLSACYPLRIKRLRLSVISSRLSEMVSAGLVRLYRYPDQDGRIYGYFPTFQEHQGPARAKRSKYPDPPPANICSQMRANVPVLSDLGSRSTTTDPPHPPQGGTPAKTAGEGPAAFEAFWQEYPKPRRKGKFEARRAWTALRPTPETVARIMRSLSAWKASADWLKENGKFIPWPQKFLNRHRWEEIPELSGPENTARRELEDDRRLLGLIPRTEPS